MSPFVFYVMNGLSMTDTQGGDRLRDSSPPISNVVSDSTVGYLVQVGVLTGTLNVHFADKASAPPDPVERAADTLARSVFNQWREEANAWDMASPEPLAVRWMENQTDSDHADKIGVRVSGRGDQVNTMANTFLGTKQRRLVILGGVGAGKTTLAVLLALELLTRRLRDGDRGPVPVILSLGSWDAEREHLHTWLARRLAEDYPGLPDVDGRRPAMRLIQERKVLPVLDGLDELPEHRRRAIVVAANRALTPGDPLVVTSRSAEYRALSRSGHLIDSAAVIEALPVTPADAVAYLHKSTAPALAPRWEPVFAQLIHTPAAPVAEALSTPLMLWLARRAYAHPPADPAELTNVERFPTAAAIEGHLLDRLIPAVFTSDPHGPDRLHAPGQWNPERAYTWLAYLASHLSRQQTTDLAWWRLHRATPPRLMGLPALAVSGFLFSQILAGASWLFTGHSAGIPDLIAMYHPGFEPDDPDSAAALLVAGALLTGLLTGFTTSLTADRVFNFRWDEPRRRANPLRVGAALRSVSRSTSARRVVYLGLPIIAPGAILTLLALHSFGVSGFVPGLLTGVIGYALPAMLMLIFAAPSDTVDASTPDALLQSERRTALLMVTVIAPLVGIGHAGPGWFVDPVHSGLPRALVGWLGCSALLVLISPWSRWLLTKWSLALAGKAPWSLAEFLRDAHHNGVLRRVGGTYQFRNLLLQKHLADTAHQRAAIRAGAPAQVGKVSPGPQPASSRGEDPTLRPAPTRIPPISEVPGFSVINGGPTSYLVKGEVRWPVNSHWPLVLRTAAIVMLIILLLGGVRQLIAWSPVFALLIYGAARTIVACILPKRSLELHITAEFISASIGRHQIQKHWQDVERVAIRPLARKGRSTGNHALHIRLHPWAVRPPWPFESGNDWYGIFPTYSNRTLPPDISAALMRFAGQRWQPPIIPS